MGVHGREWIKFSRRVIAMHREMDTPCVRCGRPIDYALPGSALMGPTTDHLTPLMLGGELFPDLSMVGPAHRSCNSRHGALMLAAQKRKAKLGPAPHLHPDPLEPKPPLEETLGITSALWTGDYVGDGGPFVAVGGELPALWADCEWLVDLVDPGENGTWPRLMSAPHPRSVGTRGPEIVERIEARRKEDPLTAFKHKSLRWWQKLVIYRLYEVDAAGELVWKKVLISTSRQVGKSVGLREIALDRIGDFAHYGEQQLVLHVAKDLMVADEIQRPARQWADMMGWPWKSVNTTGRWTVEHTGVMGRWLIRSMHGIYGYSASVAMIDEAWAISKKSVSEGIEPTMVEKEQPQMIMVSTAHSEATDLFPASRVPAIGALDAPTLDTLIMEWSAPKGADKYHIAAHRMASPFWSPKRAEFILSKVHEDGFEEQWLNIWPDVAGGLNMLAPKEIIDATAGEVSIGPATQARTFAIYPDTLQNRWHVLVGGIDGDTVLIQYVDGFNTLNQAVEHVTKNANRGLGCDLMLPKHIRGRVRRISGVREVIYTTESDVAAATSTIRPLLLSGRVRHSGHATLVDHLLHSALETYGETVRISHKISASPVEAAKAAVLVGWWASRQDKPGAVVV